MLPFFKIFKEVRIKAIKCLFYFLFILFLVALSITNMSSRRYDCLNEKGL